MPLVSKHNRVSKKMCYSTDCLKVVHRIATVLAIWPPYLHDHRSRIVKIYKVYGLVMVAAYTYVNWIVLVENNRHYFAHFGNLANGIVRFLQYLILYVTSIDATLRSLYTVDDFNGMILLLQRIDHGLKDVISDNRKANLELWIEFILINALMFVLVGSITIIWTYSEANPLRLCVYFQYYCLSTTTILIYNYIRNIGIKYEKLNIMLKELGEELKVSHKNSTGIKRIRVLYSCLGKSARIYNKIFGWRIFFHFSVVFIGCIQLANMITIQLFTSEGLTGALKNERTEKLEMLLSMAIRCSMLSVSIIHSKHISTLHVFF